MSSQVIKAGSGIVGKSNVTYPAGQKAKLTLGYWNIRGLAQPIRFAAAIAGVALEEVRYQQGGAPAFDRSAWMNEKEKLGLDFPNLPYLIDEERGLKLTQSAAILRHVGRLYNLIGSNAEEQARADMLLDTAYDYKSAIVATAYGRETLEKFRENQMPHYTSLFENYRAGHPTKWFAGDNLTIADIFIYEMIAQTSMMVPGSLDSKPKLKEFMEQFEALPAIAEYRKWEHYIDRPINNMQGIQ